ncbi:MAG: ABC transporter ATP-binding protein [Oligoflexia bacterium]|nr:ABC transporter ATP-binding protein [Oligoflexia bacterium]
MIPALEVKNLHKNFQLPLTRKHIRAVDNLSFSVNQGELVGFLGANGAGKTTTLKSIMSLIHIDQGSIKIFGSDHHKVEARREIGFLTERPYFYDYLTGREFLFFVSKLFKDRRSSERVDDLLKEVGLEHAADRQLRRYSKGMLQRIGVAQALINDPKLLILDEPMSGLDPDGRAELSNIIRRCHQRGVTVLFSTHLLHDVEVLCDRVVIIDGGKLILESGVRELIARHSKGHLLSIRKASGEFSEQVFESLSELQKGIDQARAAGHSIVRVDQKRQSMEEIFLAVKKGLA